MDWMTYSNCLIRAQQTIEFTLHFKLKSINQDLVARDNITG